MKTRKIIKNNKGSALSFVLFTLLIVSILVGIVASLAQTNIRQAGDQEKSLQTYYIARSGVELAYEVIMTTSPSLLESFRTNPDMELTHEDIDFGEGTADIRVTSKGTGDNQKIYIESTGKLKDSKRTRTVKLEFYRNYDKSPGLIWS